MSVINEGLSVCNVWKTYGNSTVLTDVSLSVAPGEIAALVGGNGAGKSTLVKIVGGAIRPDRGDVLIDGAPLSGPPSARSGLGLAVVHQDRQLCGDLTVAENVMLRMKHEARPSSRRWIPGRVAAGLLQRAEDELLFLTKGIGLNYLVRQLSVAQQQMCEIACALAGEARVIVLDEPTSALSRSEVERLHGALRAIVTARRVAIMYISHNLDDVLEIADRVCVLKDGVLEAVLGREELNKAELLDQMFGRGSGVSIGSTAGATPSEAWTTRPGRDASRDPVVEIRRGSYRHRFDNVDFALHQGEVVALRGSERSGVNEVARVIAGQLSLTSGHCLVRRRGDHQMVEVRSRGTAVRSGIGIIPGNRELDGVVPDMTIGENLELANVAAEPFRRAWRNRTQRSRQLAEVYERLHVKGAGLFAPIGSLSGGNQQKVAIGRWLLVSTRVMIMENPTAGVDVASRLEIYGLIRTLMENGLAILLLPTDDAEVGELATRSLWMKDGVLSSSEV